MVKKENEKWIDHLARLEKYHTGANIKGLYYKVVFRLVNAADYGIPQKRERVFIVGMRNDIRGNWSFPVATRSEDALHYTQFITKEYWETRGMNYPDKHEPVNVSRFDPPTKKPWVTVHMRLFKRLAKQFNPYKLRTCKKTTIHSMIWRRYGLSFGEKKRRNWARYSGHRKSRPRMIC